MHRRDVERFLLYVAVGPPAGGLILLSTFGWVGLCHGDFKAPVLALLLFVPASIYAYFFGLLPAALCAIASSTAFHFIARRRTRVAVAFVIGVSSGYAAVLAYGDRVLSLGAIPWHAELVFCLISGIVSTICAVLIERLGTSLPHAS